MHVLRHGCNNRCFVPVRWLTSHAPTSLELLRLLSPECSVFGLVVFVVVSTSISTVVNAVLRPHQCASIVWFLTPHMSVTPCPWAQQLCKHVCAYFTAPIRTLHFHCQLKRAPCLTRVWRMCRAHVSPHHNPQHRAWDESTPSAHAKSHYPTQPHSAHLYYCLLKALQYSSSTSTGCGSLKIFSS